MRRVAGLRREPQVHLVLLALVDRQKRVPVHVEVQPVSRPARDGRCAGVRFVGGRRAARGVAAAERFGQLGQARAGVRGGGRRGVPRLARVRGRLCRRRFRRRRFRRRVGGRGGHGVRRVGRRDGGTDGLVGGLLAFHVVLVLLHELLELVGGQRVGRVLRFVQRLVARVTGRRLRQVRVRFLGVVDVEEHFVPVERLVAVRGGGGLVVVDGGDGRRDVLQSLLERVLRQGHGVVVVGQQPYVFHDLRYPVDVHGPHARAGRVEHVVPRRRRRALDG